MEELIEKIKEILDVEELDVKKSFAEYEEWDSLCSLSILAMLDSDYHTSMTGKEVASFKSIEEFCKAVVSK